MKKVLVMAAALSLFAAPALASSVVDSKHNLSTNGPGAAGLKSTNYSEVCVFCHTPHGANQAITGAPLWNRSATSADFSVGDLYNSSTLEATSRPSANGNLAAINASDAKLCFSCHDGTNLVDGLLNPANTSGNAQPAGLNGAALNTADLLEAGVMLKNDHPIGIDYSKAAITDGELNNPPTNAAIDVTYGADDRRMWCSSCHDVHDDAYGPFLVMSNSQSALCVACHIK